MTTGKKNIVKLVKKKIIDKTGKTTTVYVLPTKEKPVVEKQSNNLDLMKEKYGKKYPLTFGVMTQGEWDDLGNIKLNNYEWKKILKEQEGLIVNLAKKFNYYQIGGERFEELKHVGHIGLKEALDNYGKSFNSKNPIDIYPFINKQVKGRMQEVISNRLKAGLRIPAMLNKPFNEYKKVKEDLVTKLGHQPTNLQISEELQKIWNKKTFYPQYKLTGNVDVDKLPIEDYVSISKKEKAKEKEKIHNNNIEKIDKKYEDSLSNLEELNLLSENKTVEEREIELDIINKIENDYDKSKKDYLDALNEKLEKLKLSEENPDEVYDVSEDNIKIKKLNKLVKKKLNDLEIAKEYYKDIDSNEYSRRKRLIEMDKNNAMDDETHRYNKDIDSTVIPGIMDRVREFNQIEAINELPININYEDKDGDSKSVEEKIVLTQELTEQKKLELIEQHKNGKKIMIDSIEKLAPVHSEAFKLYTGLHEKSSNDKNSIWGELSNVTDITKFLEDKYKNQLNNPESILTTFHKLPKDKKIKILGNVPFVKFYYRKDIKRLEKDVDNWMNKKSGIKKIKIDEKTFSNKNKEYESNKTKAKKEWTQWKDDYKNKNGKYPNQIESTNKYDSIKKENKATKEYIPKKFIEQKIELKGKQLEQWRKEMPDIFMSGETNRRQAYVNSILEDSKEIMRRTIPVKVVKDLLLAHRQLVDNGIQIIKGIDINEILFDKIFIRCFGFSGGNNEL